MAETSARTDSLSSLQPIAPKSAFASIKATVKYDRISPTEADETVFAVAQRPRRRADRAGRRPAMRLNDLPSGKAGAPKLPKHQRAPARSRLAARAARRSVLAATIALRTDNAMA